ncbi:MAG TPA: WbuC family cupin fold metalloprotein [Candidatus Acidoferrum sp.]|nr:WbuC family cupin fold metalloprotein [Candidatus Acidoferrum sp.]
MSRFKKVSEEVFVAQDSLVQVDRAQLDVLKTQAALSPRHRARLCAHQDAQDRLHEMLIVLTRQVYIRPHKHINKTESFHVIEGSALVLFFDDAGAITEVISLGDAASGRPFYFRNDDSRYHTQLITSDFLVFHEITNGPFNRADTLFAPWSPDETETAAVRAFVEKLKRDAAQLREAR